MRWEEEFNKKPLKISDPKKGKLNLLFYKYDSCSAKDI